MFKIAGTLPVKTRLPFAAWVIAGLVTIYSFMASLVTPAFNHAEQASTSAPETHHKSAQSTVGPLKCGVPHAAFLEHRGRNSCLTRASGSSRASQRLRSLKWSSIPVRRVHA